MPAILVRWRGRDDRWWRALGRLALVAGATLVPVAPWTHGALGAQTVRHEVGVQQSRAIDAAARARRLEAEADSLAGVRSFAPLDAVGISGAYLRAAALYRETRDQAAEARALVRAAGWLSNGRLVANDSAIALVRRAVALTRETGDRVAEVERRVSLAYYYGESHLDAPQHAQHDSALTLARELARAGDVRPLAGVLHELGAVVEGTRPDSAFALYDSAAALRRAAHDSAGLADALESAAYLHERLARHADSVGTPAEAARHWAAVVRTRRAGASGTIDSVDALLRWANAAARTGDTATAIVATRSAIVAARATRYGHELQEAAAAAARIFERRGPTDSLAAALALLYRVQHALDDESMGLTARRAAEAFERAGRVDSASRYLAYARAALAEAPSAPESALTSALRSTAALYLRAGRPDSAAAMLRQSDSRHGLAGKEPAAVLRACAQRRAALLDLAFLDRHGARPPRQREAAEAYDRALALPALPRDSMQSAELPVLVSDGAAIDDAVLGWIAAEPPARGGVPSERFVALAMAEWTRDPAFTSRLVRFGAHPMTSAADTLARCASGQDRLFLETSSDEIPDSLWTRIGDDAAALSYHIGRDTTVAFAVRPFGKIVAALVPISRDSLMALAGRTDAAARARLASLLLPPPLVALLPEKGALLVSAPPELRAVPLGDLAIAGAALAGRFDVTVAPSIARYVTSRPPIRGAR